MTLLNYKPEQTLPPKTASCHVFVHSSGDEHRHPGLMAAQPGCRLTPAPGDDGEGEG